MMGQVQDADDLNSVRSRTTGLIRRKTKESTMNVYGPARAGFIIHINSPP
jgi:hypothetical protein